MKNIAAKQRQPLPGNRMIIVTLAVATAGITIQIMVGAWVTNLRISQVVLYLH